MMELLLGIVIGIVAGYHFGVVHSMMKLKEFILKEAKIQGIKLDDENTLEAVTVKQLVIEEVNSVLYLYDRDRNTFLCQGTSIEELAKLANQYKNIKYAAVVNGEKVYAFVNGEVKTEL